MISIRRLLTQGVNTGSCFTDSWNQVNDLKHYTYFRLRSVDGRLDQRVTKSDMRHSSLSAFKHALHMLEDSPAGVHVFWSDSMMVHIRHSPDKCPLCFCAESYMVEDAKYVRLCYYDESGVRRAIDPTNLLAYFKRG